MGTYKELLQKAPYVHEYRMDTEHRKSLAEIFSVKVEVPVFMTNKHTHCDKVVEIDICMN